ncbi:hypothetical protein BDV93DRAFT_553973 [Ceratobasidium sp. AG-I]|nr:hypothetical protein BDV93DRAFT_553973 [Ceratobasidium sp. AG-I]
MLIGNSQYPSDSDLHDGYSKAAALISIPRLQNLRILSSSPLFLDPDILQLLGKLPYLESLTAYSLPRQLATTQDANDDQALVASLALPMNSFPALQHLGIHSQLDAVVSKLWRITPLVQGLVSVTVRPMGGSTKSLNNLVDDVCRGSPLIRDLDLDLVPDGQDEVVELLTTVVERFRQMPLQRVRLRAWYIDYQHLTLVLRNVEYLKMEATPAEISDLALISKNMPKLQYLGVNLHLFNWPPASHWSDHSPSPRTCHIDSQFEFGDNLGLDEPDFQNYVEIIAQALHVFWPKGVRCGLFMNAKGYYMTSDSDTVDCINKITKELSGTSAPHIPERLESESHWMYANW